jgi:hypothetical protein
MTAKEALDYMENEIRCIQRARYCDRDCVNCALVKEDKPLIEAFGKAIEALEKQIPRKYEVWNGQCCCPNCNVMFGNYDDLKLLKSWKMDYCKFCGQALDWSDGEREEVEEVVRCKDCKYFQLAKVNNKGFLICSASGMEITETDYCSYGERKENDS